MTPALEYYVACNLTPVKLDSNMTAIVVFPDCPEIPVVEKY